MIKNKGKVSPNITKLRKIENALAHVILERVPIEILRGIPWYATLEDDGDGDEAKNLRREHGST